MRPRARLGWSLGFLSLAALLPPALALGADPVTLVLVNKRVTVAGSPPEITFLPLPVDTASRNGFVEFADYASQALYEGPEANAEQFRKDVVDQGYEVDTATDLNYVSFHDHQIDPDTGVATPPFPTPSTLGVLGAPQATADASDTLFLLVLKGFPTESWLADLRVKNIRLVEALPPVTYLVRGPAVSILALPGSTNYARGAFPVLANMKTFPFPAPPSDSPFRPVWIQAIEESPSDSIQPFLESVADGPADRAVLEGKSILYYASLTDLDTSVASTFGNVYAISSAGQLTPSSERQGILILQPTFNGSKMTLPPGNPNYAAVLINKGICDFSNTRIGMLDTGFDDGTNTHPDFQVGGAQVTVLKESIFTNAKDKYTHGTVTASVAVGFAPYGSTRKDSQGYRYTLGLAESAKLVTDKIFECFPPGASLTTALDNTMASQNLNIISISINNTSLCQYTADSALLDSRTRTKNWLFTVSAGNDATPTGSSCHTVQTPATAKNGIAAGATNNYTPGLLNWTNCPPGGTCDATRGNTCPWNGVQPDVDQDARNIPDFSAYRNPTSLMKPDLVAPAVRITGPVARNAVNIWCSTHGIFCNESIATVEGVTYGFSAGTSFAAPAVAGAAAVARKWYRKLKAVDPSPAMTKAILINGARDLNGAKVKSQTFATVEDIKNLLFPPGPSYHDHQGWGMVNLASLLDTNTTCTTPSGGSNHFAFDQGFALANNNTWATPNAVTNGALDTRITLVWTDVVSSAGANYNAVNNLDLLVCNNFAVKCYYANRFDSASKSLPTPPNPSFSDSGNVVEEVVIPGGTFASGTSLFINVIGKNIMMGTQDFAVFSSNAH